MFRFTSLLAVTALISGSIASGQTIDDSSYLETVSYSAASTTTEVACGCDVNSCGCESAGYGCDSGACGCQDCGCDACGCGRWYLFPQDECGVNLYGWANLGFMGNTDSPASRFNGPYNAVDRSNEFMMNQLYLVAEKGLSDCHCGFGFRVDALYGEDFFLAESIGLEKNPDGSAHWNGEYYGLSIPQAYATMGTNDLSLQVGHFYSIVGYEGVMAPSNFFYSKAYSYQFAGPFTSWGGQVNWNISDAWSLQVGVHNGWDALDRTSDRLGFAGKIRYNCLCSGAWTSFAITTGDEFNNSAGLPIANDTTNRTRYSWIVDIPFGCGWEYVFHHWLGFQEDGAVGGGDANWYGIDQYLYYTFNDCWKAGLRFEWFNDDDGTRVGLNRARNPNVPPFAGDFYSVTLGANWTPTDNFTLRPEIRADWYTGNAAPLPFDDGTEDNQLTLGLDAILVF